MKRDKFRILDINEKGVWINQLPHTRREKGLLEQALEIAKIKALEEMMKQYLKEQAEEYERRKSVYPKGYRINRAPWL